MAQTQLNRVYVQTIDSTGTTDPTLSLGVKSLTTTVKIGGIGTGGNSINVSSTGINMSGPLNALGQTNLQNTSILNVGVTGQTTLQNTSINGTLNAAGLATLINVSTTSLSVLNNVSVGGNVSVTGNLYVSSTMILPTLTVGSNAVLENASIMGTLKATEDLTTLKNVSVNETLDVVGLTTLNGLTVNQGANFYNSVGIANNSLTITGTGGFSVGGQTTLQNTSVQGLTASGKTWLSNTSITGQTDINVTGTATTTIGSSNSGTVVAGTLGVTGRTILANVSSTALTTGPIWAGATTLGVTGTGALTAASLSVTGNETVTGTLGVTGATTLGVTGTGALTAASLSVTGNETVTGTLGVTGDTTLNNLNFNNNKNITLTGPYSASSTTGKLIFMNNTFGKSVSFDSPTGPVGSEDAKIRLRVQASGANFESISVNANNGNVAIGQSEYHVPTNTLDVSGSTYFRGNVGVGTSTPKFPLTIYSTSATSGVTGINSPNGEVTGATTSVKYFNLTYDMRSLTVGTIGSGSDWPYNNVTSIYTYGSIISTASFIAVSDRRIKTNIVDIVDDQALVQLRLLKPKRYQYKDFIEKGSQPVYGFIAQEVKEVLDYASYPMTDTIPNIYETATFITETLTLAFNTSDLSRDASGALFTKLKVKTRDLKDEFVNILEVIDEHTLKVDKDLTEWGGQLDASGQVVPGDKIFVYGQEVNDFHNLNKDAIWTVATAALQEVDRQLQAEKQKTATLETTLASTQATLAAVLARLDALEQRNA